jgi:hypothetical protein
MRKERMFLNEDRERVTARGFWISAARLRGEQAEKERSRRDVSEKSNKTSLPYDKASIYPNLYT